VDTLVGTGLLKEWPEPLGEDVVKYTYELSNKGKELATRTERALDKKLLTKIQESSEEMKGLSTSELVSLSKKVFGY
jgi:hypothetical protein